MVNTGQKRPRTEHVHPDLIILDLLFGGETRGWQMLEQIHARPSTASIPVMLCSAANAQLEAHQDVLRAKGVRVVAKPFDVEELLAGIQEVFDPVLEDQDALWMRREDDHPVIRL